MTAPGDIRSDLEPDAPQELILLAERLHRERPVPAAGFRGELRRRLVSGSMADARPARLARLITGYATAGTTLLLVAALSAAGVGPLAA